MEQKILTRFWGKVLFTTDCWEWTATKTKNGYGRFNNNGVMVRSHRFAYELYKGKIPKDSELDHLCRVRHCVNPDHLEAVTRKENCHRGDLGLINKSKTHCKNGHEFNEKNTYQRSHGARTCRECNRIRAMKYR